MKKFTEIKRQRPVKRIVEQEITLEKPESTEPTDQITGVEGAQPSTDHPVVGEEGSSVTKFFSKIFESREMSHVYHLQVKGDQGSHATHEALGSYYEKVIDILDDTIEVYQAQYGLVDGYEVIDTSDTKSKEPLAYFEELAEYIKHGKKCISDEDTHIHSLIDDIVVLLYKTIYKLKFLK